MHVATLMRFFVLGCIVAGWVTIRESGVRAQSVDASEAADSVRGGVRWAGPPRSNRAVPSTHTVRQGDTLWDITAHYFGDPYQWPRVWSYNPEITNPHWIYPQNIVRLGDGQGGGPALNKAAAATSTSAPRSVVLRDRAYLDREALESAAKIVGAPEEQMMLGTFDDVYIRFEGEAQPHEGKRYAVFREIDDEDEAPETEDGVIVRVFGTVKLRNYDRKKRAGRATIVEALDPIERGYRVAEIPRRFEVVPPVPNRVNREGKIVATLRPRDMIGSEQLVFIDKGSEEGIALGNTLRVIRQGDDWRASLPVRPKNMGAREPNAEELEDEEFPVETVALGRVVHTRPHTAAVFVTSAERDVVVGDRVLFKADVP